MKPFLETLSPTAVETLISWCQDHGYDRVRELAARPLSEGGLDLRISNSSLQRLNATHNIAESKEARAQHAASLRLANKHATLLRAARENLELRLLELSADPKSGLAELRFIGQTLARFESLTLGQQRLQLAKKREARITKENTPPRPQTLEEVKDHIDVLLGKNFAKDDPQSAPSAMSALSDLSSPNPSPAPSARPPLPCTPNPQSEIAFRNPPRLLPFPPTSSTPNDPTPPTSAPTAPSPALTTTGPKTTASKAASESKPRTPPKTINTPSRSPRFRRSNARRIALLAEPGYFPDL